MSSTTRARCRQCGKHRDEAGEITWGGYCIDCGLARERENVAQMMARSGPNWNRWRRAMAACVGGVLREDAK